MSTSEAGKGDDRRPYDMDNWNKGWEAMNLEHRCGTCFKAIPEGSNCYSLEGVDRIFCTYLCLERYKLKMA